MINEDLSEWRCEICDRLLFKGILCVAKLEIKCPGCGTKVFFERRIVAGGKMISVEGERGTDDE